MNFFEHQDKARRTTLWLVLLFGVAVLLLISLTSALLLLVFNGGELPGITRPFYAGDWKLVINVSMTVLLIVVFGSLFRHLQLSGGGKVVAEALGGRQILPDTQDTEERQLLNLVEEMAIASGMPVPPVYLIQDPAINAFAAGYTLQDAVVGITSGALQQLNREELQGVIAHEFSHIHNGDMRLNIRLVALLNGILIIALGGRLLLHSASRRSFRTSRDNRGAGVVIGVGLALMLLGYIGLLFGKLIKAAVSRQREFLADASAVQFTRNPEGIAGALRKIAGYPDQSRLQSGQAEEFSHLFFSNAVSRSFSGLLATHPPLDERIARLQPHLRRWKAPSQSSGTTATASTTAGISGFAAGQTGVSGETLQQAVDQWQEPDQQQLDTARRLLAEIPEVLKEAAHEPWSARAVIYGLLLSDQLAIREQQLQALAEQAAPDTYAELLKLLPDFTELPTSSHLPLAEICVPALKQMTAEQARVFNTCMLLLIRADQQVSLKEWCLARLLQYHLRPQANRKRQNRNLHESAEALNRLLSMMAYAGQSDEHEAEAAFAAACRELQRTDLQLLPEQQLSYRLLDEALTELLQIKPLQKPRLLKAMARCIEADGRISQQQADLFRLLGATLDCPLPPLQVTNPKG
ncbi:M48 family metallopeptidase [Marinospirillum alkaliphilum]|uniref:Zn-dependent protease with chaperone function n=1 Tax=Marinospirillum alkaliphilum DSM 21637 TaxID=1122209 RepID=A0A1K1YKB5_9GAMM|nr:M48 family metallopeptidase [Marinospirillum alkaliphilum]SFX61885.1 Zn-dependent protease with chaperone function [Marinospirillum alkaliphilum DSM 21637]